jgi:hypothetical protein
MRATFLNPVGSNASEARRALSIPPATKSAASESVIATKLWETLIRIARGPGIRVGRLVA